MNNLVGALSDVCKKITYQLPIEGFVRNELLNVKRIHWEETGTGRP